MKKIESIQETRGAVLVVSLIMLAVVTFLVIAYLAFAQRDRTSINMSVIQTETRFLLDTGTAMAQAEVARNIVENKNYQLLVSVNIDGVSQESPYAAPEVSGLLTKARAPVYYDHNRDGKFDIGNGKPDEFRYWLDLNRDGNFQPTLGSAGDPHWIGVLEDPAQPHGPENRFIGRYAYMIVPASKTLDLNHIHNWAKNTEGEGFLRLGGWTTHELNLAGTLGALRSLDPLNGQGWLYELYNPKRDETSRGTAFQDAAGLFRYRKLAKPFYDLLDLYTPVRAGPQNVPKAINYINFTRRLERSGDYAFYDLAGAVSTQEQPIPTGKFNLNDYSSLVVDLDRIDPAGDMLICKKPHHFPAGARLCLYSDTGVSPQIVDGNSTRKIESYDVFFAEPVSDDPLALKLYRNFIPGNNNEPVKFLPSERVDFTETISVDLWRGSNPATNFIMRYAQNDIVRAVGTDADGNARPLLLLATNDHVSSSDLANDILDLEGLRQKLNADVNSGKMTQAEADSEYSRASAANHWVEISTLPKTQYVLDRSLEMFEEVAARLLQARAENGRDISAEVVGIGADEQRPLFNIQVSDLVNKHNSPNWWDPQPTANKSEYSPEIQRLLQVAANIVDIYTPGPFPSVFRPVYGSGIDGSGRNRIFIRNFIKEPTRCFLAKYPARNVRNVNEGDGALILAQLATDRDRTYERIGHLYFDNKAWAMPLFIGAKNHWEDSNGNGLKEPNELYPTPALNEVSVQCVMRAMQQDQSLHPWVRVTFETKSWLNSVKLHAQIQASGKIYMRKTKPDGTMSFEDPYFVTPPGSSIQQYLAPNPNGFAINRIERSLEHDPGRSPYAGEIVFNRGNGNFFDRHPWGIPGPNSSSEHGSIDVVCTLTTPYATSGQVASVGKKDRILDHSDLQMEMDVYENFTMWRQPWTYKKDDEVYYKGERYLYKGPKGVSSNVNDNNIPDPDITLDVVTGQIIPKFDSGGDVINKSILDPDKWTMLNWTWNQAKDRHPVLYPKGAVIKQLVLDSNGAEDTVLYTAKNDYPPAGNPASDAGLGGPLEVYGGEICEWSWQVNDPFLNGQEMDYRDFYNPDSSNPTPDSTFAIDADGNQTGYGRKNRRFPPGPPPLGFNVGSENSNWQPWSDSFDVPENHTYKDPGVTDSRQWDFPVANTENLLRSIGDLGRVHRGTPWQTIYLKANPADPGLWREWAITRMHRDSLEGKGSYGVNRSVRNYHNDFKSGGSLDSNDLGEKFAQTHPTNDWPLLENFSVAPGDDSMRGLLSVNQAGRAAWAAALAGVAVLPDHGLHAAPGDGKMSQIVLGINSHRKGKRGEFPYARVTEILGVPQLTSESPYLPPNATEWHYEAIPRQILSLLRVEETPYFIAYVYSQALRPAPRSILRKGPNKGMCINYQVMGEAGARTVFRLEGAQEWADYHEALLSGTPVAGGGLGGLGGLLGGMLGGAGGLGGGAAGGLGGLLGGAGGLGGGAAGGLGGLLGGAGGLGGGAAGGLGGLLGGASGLGGVLSKPPPPRVVLESYAPVFVR